MIEIQRQRHWPLELYWSIRRSPGHPSRSWLSIRYWSGGRMYQDQVEQVGIKSVSNMVLFSICGDDQIQLNIPKQRSNLSNCWCTDSSDRMDLLDSAYNRRDPRFILDSQPCFLLNVWLGSFTACLVHTSDILSEIFTALQGIPLSPMKPYLYGSWRMRTNTTSILAPKKWLAVSCIVPSGCLLDEARIAHQQGANESVGKPGMKQLFPYPTKTWWHLIITGSARDSPRSAEGRGSQVGL